MKKPRPPKQDESNLTKWLHRDQVTETCYGAVSNAEWALREVDRHSGVGATVIIVCEGEYIALKRVFDGDKCGRCDGTGVIPMPKGGGRCNCGAAVNLEVRK